jgi:hypothetical protein
MEEATLINNWNHLRKNIAQSQMISVIILAVACSFGRHRSIRECLKHG